MEDDKDFKVTDKRIRLDEIRAAEEKKKAEIIREKGAAEGEGSQPRLPHIDFSSFIFSLAHSAFIQLGEEPDPFTGERKVDIQQAQETIDLLSVLEEKTKGNLTKDETALMKNLLYALRMKYVERGKKHGK